MSEDTIAAVSTPAGRGAIGIVRLSGPAALSIAARLFRGDKDAGSISGFSAARGWVEREGERLDEVVCLVMHAPHSYTREDVVELQCHGGPVPVARVLDAVLAEGARLALPGEFTRRAYLSGRIDLTQAEAVADLILSETQAAARAAASQVDGALGRQVKVLYDQALELLALVEAGIDFSDQDIEVIPRADLMSKVEALMQDISALLKNSERGRLIREGMQAAIAGRPNVGKSTLMNALLRTSRVIVTPYPGTTRDVVEDTADIHGIPVRLMDTAGIRDTSHPIEKEGVERSRRALSEADLILLVLDTSEPLTAEDHDLLSSLVNRSVIAVLNKADLNPAWSEQELDRYSPKKIARISALHGRGIEELEREIAACAAEGESFTAPVLITNVRHRDALRRAENSLGNARSSAQNKLSDEFIALDLREAVLALGEIIGQSVTESMLDVIFSRFCIGK